MTDLVFVPSLVVPDVVVVVLGSTPPSPVDVVLGAAVPNILPPAAAPVVPPRAPRPANPTDAVDVPEAVEICFNYTVFTNFNQILL